MTTHTRKILHARPARMMIAPLTNEDSAILLARPRAHRYVLSCFREAERLYHGERLQCPTQFTERTE